MTMRTRRKPGIRIMGNISMLKNHSSKLTDASEELYFPETCYIATVEISECLGFSSI